MTVTVLASSRHSPTSTSNVVHIALPCAVSETHASDGAEHGHLLLHVKGTAKSTRGSEWGQRRMRSKSDSGIYMTKDRRIFHITAACVLLLCLTLCVCMCVVDPVSFGY